MNQTTVFTEAYIGMTEKASKSEVKSVISEIMALFYQALEDSAYQAESLDIDPMEIGEALTPHIKAIEKTLKTIL